MTRLLCQIKNKFFFDTIVVLSAAQHANESAKETALDWRQSERQLLENTYQLETIGRKIFDERNVAEANIRRQCVADFLNGQSSDG